MTEGLSRSVSYKRMIFRSYELIFWSCRVDEDIRFASILEYWPTHSVHQHGKFTWMNQPWNEETFPRFSDILFFSREIFFFRLCIVLFLKIFLCTYSPLFWHIDISTKSPWNVQNWTYSISFAQFIYQLYAVYSIKLWPFNDASVHVNSMQ